MPTKSGAGTTRRSRAAPRGRPGGSSGCGGRGPRAAQLLCLSPKGLSGLQKSNVFLAATLQHVFESIKKSATIKPPLPPVAGGHWDPRVGGAGASLAWLVAGARAGLTGLTGLCSAQDAPDRRLAFGLWPPSSVPGHTGSRGSGWPPAGPWLRGSRVLAFRKDRMQRQEPFLLGGWVGGVLRPQHTFHDSQVQHCPPDLPPLPERSG